jgi:hypothetical protein
VTGKDPVNFVRVNEFKFCLIWRQMLHSQQKKPVVDRQPDEINIDSQKYKTGQETVK